MVHADAFAPTLPRGGILDIRDFHRTCTGVGEAADLELLGRVPWLRLSPLSR
jgi:hypothetical protein